MADATGSTRLCKACSIRLPVSEFYRRLNRHGNLSIDCKCKACRFLAVQVAKRRRMSRPSEVEKVRESRRQRKRLERRHGSASQHDAHVRKRNTVLRAAARYATPRAALDRRMSTSVYHSLKGAKAFKSWTDLVGYTIDQLHSHIERQFTKGMTWSNMGEWHIDHILPKSMFKYESPECDGFRHAWALTNLRPLWAADNLSKNDARLHLL